MVAPITLPMAQSTIAARLASGDLTDATPNQVRSLLDIVGVVRMIQVGPTRFDWKVFDKDGAEVDISSSVTGGLQEAINATIAPIGVSSPLYIIGAGVINAGNTGVVFHPMSTQQVYMDAGVISFSILDGTPGFRFKSMINCDIIMRGKIVYGGSGPCVQFKAEGSVENTVSITNSRILFTTLDAIGSVAQGNESTGIEIDRTNGSFLQNRLEVMKIDVKGDTEGGKPFVVKDNASFGFIENDIYLYDLRQANVGLQEGETSGAGIARNRYMIFQSGTKGTNPIGLHLHGQNSEYIYDLNSASAGATGIKLEPSSDALSFRIYKNAAATPITDNSTTKNHTFHQNGRITGLLQSNIYTVATVPSAALNRGVRIQVSDASGGEIPVFSDGTDWRHYDRTILS